MEDKNQFPGDVLPTGYSTDNESAGEFVYTINTGALEGVTDTLSRFVIQM
jgi:hypothetical protein